MNVAPRDIYKWDSEDLDGPFTAGSKVFRSDELEIEKKWLQLAKIDPEQFSLFFDKYHDRILAYAFWKTGDLDLAADVTNTVFAVAWEKLGRFRWQGYTFGAWLFQLARGELANTVRRRERHQEVEFQPDLDDRLDEESPDQLLEQDSDTLLLQDCLQKLDDLRHDIFVLHYWVGLSTAQVGVVLKVPEGTVCSNLDRGRRQLLKCLEEKGIQGGMSRLGNSIVKESLRNGLGLHLIDGNPVGDAKD